MASKDNVGLRMARLLLERFGFQEAGIPGRFRKITDSQHAVIVSVTPWDEFGRGGGSRAQPEFGIARRDINELWGELLTNPSITPLHPTMESGAHRFLGQPRAMWGSDTSENEIVAWLDQWVPRLVAEVPSLPFLQRYLALATDRAALGEIIPNAEIAAANTPAPRAPFG